MGHSSRGLPKGAVPGAHGLAVFKLRVGARWAVGVPGSPDEGICVEPHLSEGADSSRWLGQHHLVLGTTGLGGRVVTFTVLLPELFPGPSHRK